ncbi:protein ERGIC-53-like [Tubulanus polymorphus]|uniref:protein ERGIC-53-like n=1 Tax=Tubulanus polymorphus TaxID=672921 RepID=UPI003DA490AF
MASFLMWLFISCSAGIVSICLAAEFIEPHKRFEYKYSFKGPSLVSKEGSIPFWEHGGSAIASDESVRITPSLRSKRGFVWSKQKVNFEHWQIDIKFRINGRGRIGADGLGIWYTESRANSGPVFGNQDKWKGLGIFFDSFDNDAQHNNPYVMAMVNDGTIAYSHETDGQQQQLGGCLRDFRNKPFPLGARIEFYQGVLTVYVLNGMSSNEADYELCMRAENVQLPKQGYFGVTAATGALADDHDVLSFLTTSLKPKPKASTPGGAQVNEDERKRLEEEFEKYWEKLQQAKEEYKKEHPDKTNADEQDENKVFESQGQRELKQIYDSQNAIHSKLRDLDRKMDEIVGRQERTMSQISGISAGGVQGGSASPGGAPIDTIKRHEVDEVMTNIRESIRSIRDIKNVVNVVQGHTTKIGSSGSGGSGGVNLQYEKMTHEMRDNLNTVRDNVQNLLTRQQVNEPNDGKCATCISNATFIGFIVLQTILFLGYTIYKNKQDSAMKKFY